VGGFRKRKRKVERERVEVMKKIGENEGSP